MKPLIKFFLAAMALLPAFYASTSTADERMNVLVLIADDLNTWILEKPERYSGKVIAPNLQSLGESGMVFTQAYSASPFCVPSRTSMWSGVSPHKSGVYHNQTNVGASAPLKEATSLFETFKKAGYSMYGYGKITHGWSGEDVWNDKQGHKRDPRPPGAPIQSVGKGEQDWGPIHLTEEQMNDTGGADKTIAILEEEHEKPFFLVYGTFNPHMAWFVPQKYFDLFPLDEVKTPELNPNDFDDIPPLANEVVGGKRKFTQSVLEAGLHKSAVQAYLATTAYVDAQHGRVLDALEKSPYRENTIVVFLSDHGFHLAEKDHWQKGTLWEEATNSMLMLRVPGVTAPGRVTGRCVSLQDIYPTLLELCQLERPSHVDGKSLLPILRNPEVDWESTAISYLYDQYASIRTEKFRYIRYKEGQQELYDVEADPHEWTNLADHPDYLKVIGESIEDVWSAVTVTVDFEGVLKALRGAVIRGIVVPIVNTVSVDIVVLVIVNSVSVDVGIIEVRNAVLVGILVGINFLCPGSSNILILHRPIHLEGLNERITNLALVILLGRWLFSEGFREHVDGVIVRKKLGLRLINVGGGCDCDSGK